LQIVLAQDAGERKVVAILKNVTETHIEIDDNGRIESIPIDKIKKAKVQFKW